MTTIIPVILCGGSGTRLWPLSRKSLPKQFVPLVGEKNLLQLTLERVRSLGQTVFAITAEDHRFMVLEAMHQSSTGGYVVLEPSARNTAATAALAAVQAEQLGHLDSLLLLCPSDHHIPDVQAFNQTVMRGVNAAQAGAIVTFGITPTFPSTAYGYIQYGQPRDSVSQHVQRFIEKPNAEKAQALLLQGDVLWNAGIFLASARTLLNALEQHAPDILNSVRAAMLQKTADAIDASKVEPRVQFVRPDSELFTACRSQSIDFAVMEKHQNIAVVPFNGQWSDVGSWNSVAQFTPADAHNNRLHGQAIAHLASDNFVHAPHRPVVTLGTQDLLIIDTADAVLVAHSSHAEQVKDVVALLESAKFDQAATHRKVARPWGWYDSIDRGETFQVKRICVKPGASLSLQKHQHRAEHWVVVKGTAQVTRGTETLTLHANQSTYIPIGVVHRLSNTTDQDLEIIEVQSGDYLGEDDIIRLEDTYGRAQHNSQ